VPQVDILRRAGAFFTHGGTNSVQEALYNGVPLVIVPQAADQFWISARTVELGAGVVLDMSRLKPGEIRASVAQVLSGAAYASAAGCIIHCAGGHIKAADQIQTFLDSFSSPNRNPERALFSPAGVGDFRNEKAGALG
jgi:MGT family glycosyltransferase